MKERVVGKIETWLHQNGHVFNGINVAEELRQQPEYDADSYMQEIREYLLKDF